MSEAGPVAFVEGLGTARVLRRLALALAPLCDGVFSTGRLKSPGAMLLGGRRGCVILNWTENRLLDARGRPSVRRLAAVRLRLAFFRSLGLKLIWVRHNRRPHRVPDRFVPRMQHMMDILERDVDVCVCMSRAAAMERGWQHVPHPSFTDALSDDPHRAAAAVVVGRMEPYKGIEQLIEGWSAPVPLHVVGPCEGDYRRVVEEAASGRPDVELELRSLTDDAYDEVVLGHRFVLATASTRTAYVSGAVHHALSFGAVPLLADGAARAELESEGLPCLDPGMLSVEQPVLHGSFERYHDQHGLEAVTEAWRTVLCDLPGLLPGDPAPVRGQRST